MRHSRAPSLARRAAGWVGAALLAGCALTFGAQAYAKAASHAASQATSQAAQTLSASTGAASTGTASTDSACARPVYLTFDTGHMGVAPLIAEVLARQQVRVTFFAANEPTREGDGSLGDFWAPWWKSRAAEGHAFASHTFDHVYWRTDLPVTGRADGAARNTSVGTSPESAAAPVFSVRASAGPQTGITRSIREVDYCAQIERAAARLEQITGQKALPLFRAPGGKTSPRLVAAARACGFAHVGWAPAGFLGDELPSESWPNARLLAKALREVKAGDILVAHLGIWSRQDPWAPAVLEPLITGLKGRGLCFATLRDHPAYKDWIAQHGRK